jgi:hypothetical protein
VRAVPGSVVVVGVYEVAGGADAHLLELVAEVPPDEFDLGAVTQEEPGQPQENWQAPWLERYLDPSGERVLTEPFDEPPAGLATTRVVFFLHLLSFERPLLTPGGPVELVPARPVPDRLASVEYEPVD